MAFRFLQVTDWFLDKWAGDVYEPMSKTRVWIFSHRVGFGRVQQHTSIVELLLGHKAESKGGRKLYFVVE